MTQFFLFLCRESFPYEQQFNILMRFIVDQTQTPNLKVKVAILRYIEALARQMDPADFFNSSETRLAVSRIITWTTEPKSSDVRKVGGRGGVESQHQLCLLSQHSFLFHLSKMSLFFVSLVALCFFFFFFCFDVLIFCLSNRHFSPTTPPDPS